MARPPNCESRSARCEELEECEAERGDSRVPPDDRARRPEAVESDFHAKSWNRRYEELKEYRAKHGDCRVCGNALGAWVTRQRRYARKGLLPEDRARRLEAIEFAWNPNENHQDVWNWRYEELKGYRAEHGDCNVPRGDAFGAWVENQREMHKKGFLREDRAQRLEAIGFAWNGEVGEASNENEGSLRTEQSEDESELEKLAKAEPRGYPATSSDDESATSDALQGLRTGYPEEDSELGGLNKTGGKKKAARTFQPLHRVTPSQDESVTSNRLQGSLRTKQSENESELGRLVKTEPREYPATSSGGGSATSGAHQGLRTEYPEGESVLRGLGSGKKKAARKFQPLRRKTEALNERYYDRSHTKDNIYNGRWKRNFNKLLEFKNGNGHVNVPHKHPGLGTWVAHQRARYKSGKMPLNQISSLEDIGFEWVRRKGHIDNASSGGGSATSDALQGLRTEHLEEERVLGGLGKTGGKKKATASNENDDRSDAKDGVYNERWKRNFDKLVEFKVGNGHVNVPQKHPGLGTWVTYQRARYKSGKMPLNQISSLEDMGFEWVGRKGHIDNASLGGGSATSDALQGLRTEHLEEERVLGGLGKTGGKKKATASNENDDRSDAKDGVYNERWKRNFDKLVEFKVGNGHVNVPQKHPGLGTWVTHQRARYKSGKMPLNQISSLEDMGFEWVGRKGHIDNDDRWKHNFNKLVEFKVGNGHVNVPQSHPGLGPWVNNQRKRYKSGTMPLEQISSLESVGFEWVRYRSRTMPLEQMPSTESVGFGWVGRKGRKPKGDSATPSEGESATSNCLQEAAEGAAPSTSESTDAEDVLEVDREDGEPHCALEEKPVEPVDEEDSEDDATVALEEFDAAEKSRIPSESKSKVRVGTEVSSSNARKKAAVSSSKLSGKKKAPAAPEERRGLSPLAASFKKMAACPLKKRKPPPSSAAVATDRKGEEASTAPLKSNSNDGADKAVAASEKKGPSLIVASLKKLESCPPKKSNAAPTDKTPDKPVPESKVSPLCASNSKPTTTASKAALQGCLRTEQSKDESELGRVDKTEPRGCPATSPGGRSTTSDAHQGLRMEHPEGESVLGGLDKTGGKKKAARKFQPLCGKRTGGKEKAARKFQPLRRKRTIHQLNESNSERPGSSGNDRKRSRATPSEIPREIYSNGHPLNRVRKNVVSYPDLDTEDSILTHSASPDVEHNDTQVGKSSCGNEDEGEGNEHGDHVEIGTSHLSSSDECDDLNMNLLNSNGLEAQRRDQNVEIAGPTSLQAVERESLQVGHKIDCSSQSTMQGGMIRSAQEKAWYKRYEELKEYVAEHGDFNVPQRYAKRKGLGTWVNVQRNSYRNGSLLDYRIKCLDQIGFTWNVQANAWYKRYEELKEYLAEHGDCKVPKHYAKRKGLGTWVSVQRNSYKNGSLLDYRIKLLEQIGFTWKRINWKEHSKLLVEFNRKHGQRNVPCDTMLGKGTAVQRPLGQPHLEDRGLEGDERKCIHKSKAFAVVQGISEDTNLSENETVHRGTIDANDIELSGHESEVSMSVANPPKKKCTSAYLGNGVISVEHPEENGRLEESADDIPTFTASAAGARSLPNDPSNEERDGAHVSDSTEVSHYISSFECNGVNGENEEKRNGDAQIDNQKDNFTSAAASHGKDEVLSVRIAAL